MLQIFSNLGCSFDIATSFSMSSFDLFFVLMKATAEKSHIDRILQKEEEYPGPFYLAVGNLSPLQSKMQPVTLTETAVSMLNRR